LLIPDKLNGDLRTRLLPLDCCCTVDAAANQSLAVEEDQDIAKMAPVSLLLSLKSFVVVAERSGDVLRVGFT
jgi:hypothetical protein